MGRRRLILRFSFKPTPMLDGRANGGIHVVSDVTELMEAQDRRD